MILKHGVQAGGQWRKPYLCLPMFSFSLSQWSWRCNERETWVSIVFLYCSIKWRMPKLDLNFIANGEFKRNNKYERAYLKRTLKLDLQFYYLCFPKFSFLSNAANIWWYYRALSREIVHQRSFKSVTNVISISYWVWILTEKESR